MTASTRPPVAPRPAAVVVALRDGPEGLEVLTVRRTTRAVFMGGFWVFPGGAVDPGDGGGTDAGRRAAARELVEEAGLVADPADLVPLDRWITPEGLPRRYDTVFFLWRATADPDVTVDGAEVTDSRWDRPRTLLDLEARDEIQLALPTRHQLAELDGWTTVDAALRACAGRTHERSILPGAVQEDGSVLLRSVTDLGAA